MVNLSMPPPVYTVRTAQPLDAAGYIRLIRDILAESPRVDTPYAPEEFLPAVEAMRDRIRAVTTGAASVNSCFLVAESGGRVVGALTCAGGTLRADRHNTELGVYVAKGWRGQGVGTALVARAMAWAHASLVVQRVELEVMAGNDRAIHVYERHGFQHEGRRRGRYLHDGAPVDMLLMAWGKA